MIEPKVTKDNVVIRTVMGTSQEVCVRCNNRFLVTPPQAYAVKDSYFPQYICKACVKKMGVNL